MSKERIRLSRHFRFETAHALHGYDGACRNIHGHSYKLTVTVIGSPLHKPAHAKHGMVLDFGDLKRIVEREVIQAYDHALLLNSATPAPLLQALQHHYEKVLPVLWQPTSELMLLDIKNRILPHLPKGILLHSLRLSETENSFAEWFASDN